MFVPFGREETFPLVNLWDKIVLTPLEDEVMEILRETVLPELVRLDVNKERTLVRIKGAENPLPLQTFGDGVRRMLLLAVALVSAKDKLLLIDEIEAGLHHSVMEVFWDKIFFYAQKWNIQVFVTTHSHDTVKTFTYVLEKPGNERKVLFIDCNQPVKQVKLKLSPTIRKN
ncbi:MAG: ATP-binding protein [Lewinellaceae bacterium]|nr:ATP-binding protein [Lewinellaceae bacterium]